MIIEIVNTEDLAKIHKKINKHNNILIIGEAKNNHNIKKVAYLDSTEYMKKKYGDSLLYRAFKTAKDMGAPHVFVMNVKNKIDYVDAINTLRHYDFSYIVPVGLLLSDFFYNKRENNKKYYYYEYFVKTMAKYNNSVFLATDKHASLYEDIDHFVDDMTGKLNNLKHKLTNVLGISGRNICFVANNLEDYEYSSVVLASAICASDIDEYPSSDLFKKAVFNIDFLDVEEKELIYFKNNILTETTVENLLNFSNRGPVKILTIDRIVRYIIRELDLSEFKGRLANSYQRLKAEKKIAEFLESKIDYIINDYTIDSVTLFKDRPGSGGVRTSFGIVPINSTEQVSVVITVD